MLQVSKLFPQRAQLSSSLSFPSSFWGDCPPKASAAHIRRSDLESERRQESQRLLEAGLGGGGRMEGTEESGKVAIL